MKNIVKPYLFRFRSRRIVLVALVLIASFVVLVAMLCAGWFIGAIPAYPHMKSWEICTPPQVIHKSVYGTPKWELVIGFCFDTDDSSDQVAAWYEPLGWTGQNVPTDEIGIGVTGEINLGSVAQITIKRIVLFSPSDSSSASVKVATGYDLRSSMFSIP